MLVLIENYIQKTKMLNPVYLIYYKLMRINGSDLTLLVLARYL